MFSKVALAFCTIALAAASAASNYHVTLNDREWVGDKELKPGNYTIHVEADKAVIKNGKDVIETPVKVETGPRKFENTSLITADVSGKTTLQEIWLGGTDTKLILQH